MASLSFQGRQAWRKKQTNFIQRPVARMECDRHISGQLALRSSQLASSSSLSTRCHIHTFSWFPSLEAVDEYAKSTLVSRCIDVGLTSRTPSESPVLLLCMSCQVSLSIFPHQSLIVFGSSLLTLTQISTKHSDNESSFELSSQITDRRASRLVIGIADQDRKHTFCFNGRRCWAEG